MKWWRLLYIPEHSAYGWCEPSEWAKWPDEVKARTEVRMLVDDPEGALQAYAKLPKRWMMKNAKTQAQL